MSTVADVAAIHVTDETVTGGVADVATATVTNQIGRGVWVVDHASVVGYTVVADTYVPGPIGPTGDTGPTGATGPPGLVRVNHATNPDVPRPASPVVLWVGSVDPTNANTETDLIVWVT
jgi:hypothetical protein